MKRGGEWAKKLMLLGAMIGRSVFDFGSIALGKPFWVKVVHELLDAIGRHRSITAAAKIVGISYRKAWNMIQEINTAAGDTLVESAVGGVKGGGGAVN